MPQDQTLVLDKFLPYLLVNLAKRMSATLAEIYQHDYDLTIPEWRVLANLNQAGALTSKEIALQTYMSKVKVCRAIKNLTDKGWIDKQRHATDSRAYLVSLSEAGQRVIDDITPKALGWQSALLASLDAEEYNSLLNAIAKLSERLDDSGVMKRFIDQVDREFDT